LESQNYSFVVRVWLESTDQEAGLAVWRGSIEQVGSDCRFYFSDLDGITRFIRTQIGTDIPSSTSRWQAFREHVRNGIRKNWKNFLR
jgi:hypothetical protein